MYVTSTTLNDPYIPTMRFFRIQFEMLLLTYGTCDQSSLPELRRAITRCMESIRDLEVCYGTFSVVIVARYTLLSADLVRHYYYLKSL